MLIDCSLVIDRQRYLIFGERKFKIAKKRPEHNFLFGEKFEYTTELFATAVEQLAV